MHNSYRRSAIGIGMIIMLLAMSLFSASSLWAENRPLKTGAFEVVHQLTLPGTPETIFDVMTGDIGGWWDHSFSEKPLKFYIEPKPGGGFYEIYDEAGNGVKHATVTAADRGKMLRYEGPLGLAGRAIFVVTTYQFKAVGSDSTQVTVNIHAAGEMEDGVAETVDQVWHHFLFERLKPYVEAGKMKGE